MKKGLGEYSKTIEDLKAENAACTSRNTVECKPNFIAQIENERKPSIGAEFVRTENFAFENAECKLELEDEMTEVKNCRCVDDSLKVRRADLKKGLLDQKMNLCR